MKPCSGCGSTSHGSHERDTKCSAWGESCLYCRKLNHFANVCNSKITDAINAIQIGRIAYNPAVDQFTTQNKDVTEIPAEITPYSSQNRFNNKPMETQVFPDSGASASIAGPH